MSRIGNLGSPATFEVGAGGTVIAPTGMSLDWVVGAADRWHEPGSTASTAVTQHRDGGLPVVTTGLRVPGGQILHRAWCVAAGGGDVAVIELENRSRDAVAVAVVLVAPGREPARFDGERRVTVAGTDALVAGRPVARAVAGSLAAVGAGLRAGATDPAAPVAGAAVGLVFPLAHTASLRIALPAAGAVLDRPGSHVVDALPGHEAVAAGWRTHLDAGARVVLPDERVTDAVAAARARLLLGDRDPGGLEGAAARALALGRWGHADAAAALLDGVDHPVGRVDPVAAATLLAAWATASRARAGADLDGLVEPAARLAHRLARGRARRRLPPTTFATAQHDAADLLGRAGQPDAAARCRQRLAEAQPGSGATDRAGAEGPPALPEPPGPEAADEPAVAARFLLGVRDVLADDGRPGAVALLGRYPDAWLGQDIEAHGLPTRCGDLSYAVRWHGTRPALLWERVPRPPDPGAADRVLLTAPGLDRSWSSTDASGEALLAAVEPAGGLPKVVAPLGAEGTPVDEAPGDGVSFS